NPIPGLDELGVPIEPPVPAELRTAAVAAGPGDGNAVVIRRISERVQEDVQFMRELHDAGVVPDAEATLVARGGDAVEVRVGTNSVVLDHHKADALFVSTD